MTLYVRFLRTNETHAKTDKGNSHDAFLTIEIPLMYLTKYILEQTQAQSRAQLRMYSESFITSKIFSNSAEHELKLLEYDLELSTKKVL